MSEKDIKKAPRGCPGHSLSQAVIPFVVDHFVAPLAASATGADAAAGKTEL